MHSEPIDLILSSTWLMRVLGTVRDASLPDAWVGVGVLRDLVCGEHYGLGFRPDLVRDVEVPLFDPADLSCATDDRATEHLAARLTGVLWEAGILGWLDEQSAMTAAQLRSTGG